MSQVRPRCLRGLRSSWYLGYACSILTVQYESQKLPCCYVLQTYFWCNFRYYGGMSGDLYYNMCYVNVNLRKDGSKDLLISETRTNTSTKSMEHITQKYFLGKVILIKHRYWEILWILPFLQFYCDLDIQGKFLYDFLTKIAIDFFNIFASTLQSFPPILIIWGWGGIKVDRVPLKYSNMVIF